MKLSRKEALEIINKIANDRLVTTVAFELGITNGICLYDEKGIVKKDGNVVPILTVNDVIEALTTDQEIKKC